MTISEDDGITSVHCL